VFAPYYAAVLVATVVAGWSAGALASLLGLMALLWIFVPSRFLFHLFSRREAADVILYVLASATIVAIADHYRSLVRRLREEEHYRRLVVDELQHRIANKAATLHAIIGYELREHTEIWEKVAGRLQAIETTDQLIAKSDGRDAAIADIIAAELGPYDTSRVSFDGEAVELPQKPAVTLALVFHELATNAAKYGALSVSTGRLTVAWAIHGDRLMIEWVERGHHRGMDSAASSSAVRLIPITDGLSAHSSAQASRAGSRWRLRSRRTPCRCRRLRRKSVRRELAPQAGGVIRRCSRRSIANSAALAVTATQTRMKVTAVIIRMLCNPIACISR
jgi:two-component sensor histidine kinase